MPGMNPGKIKAITGHKRTVFLTNTSKSPMDLKNWKWIEPWILFR
jgi:hypothetical protein